MRRRLTSWVRALAGVLALAVGSTAAAPPVLASDRAPAGSPSPGSLSTRTATAVAKLRPTHRAFAQAGNAQTDPAGSTGRSFFKSPTGIAAIVIMAAGAGYTLYSVGHDSKPVKSPIR